VLGPWWRVHRLAIGFPDWFPGFRFSDRLFLGIGHSCGVGFDIGYSHLDTVTIHVLHTVVILVNPIPDLHVWRFRWPRVCGIG